MAILIRLVLIPALLAVGIWWLIRAMAQPKSKCGSCRFCRKEFDDGTLCGFGEKETFKNPVHVQNCTDYRRG